MERLRFGSKARRKETRRRWMLRLWLVSIAWTLVGLPSFQSVDLIGRLDSPPGVVRTNRTLERTHTELFRMQRRMLDRPPAPVVTTTTTTTTVPAAPSGSIAEIVYGAAAEFGISGAYLLQIASCESGLNPSAYNPAGYYGLFQFNASTWAAYGSGSIYDPIAQARAAAQMIAAGGASHWPNCA